MEELYSRLHSQETLLLRLSPMAPVPLNCHCRCSPCSCCRLHPPTVRLLPLLSTLINLCKLLCKLLCTHKIQIIDRSVIPSSIHARQSYSWQLRLCRVSPRTVSSSTATDRRVGPEVDSGLGGMQLWWVPGAGLIRNLRRHDRSSDLGHTYSKIDAF